MLLRVISIIAIALYIASGGGTIPNRVLCFGTDGHVAIEQSIIGLCGSIANSEAHDEKGTTSNPASPVPSGDHCGNCQDVAIQSIESKVNIRVTTIAPLTYQTYVFSENDSLVTPNRKVPTLRLYSSLQRDIDSTGFGSTLLLI